MLFRSSKAARHFERRQTHLVNAFLRPLWLFVIGDAIARKAGAAEPKSPKGPWPQWVLDGKADSGTGIFTWSNFMGWAADEKPLPAGLIGPVRLVEGK